MQKSVKISVVMPAYNSELYIKEAIDSILKQSFLDFELIIIDDGSTDKTLKIIESYRDKRIVLIKNDHNYINSLNIGMKRSKGKYIARMDSDDIMHIDRLKIQYSIMEEEPSITVCGSHISLFGENFNTSISMPSSSGVIKNTILQLLRTNIIYHPTVLIRKDFLDKNKLKYENYKYAEDYKLWFEIAKKSGIFYIDSQELLRYRISESQVTKKFTNKQLKTSYKIKDEILNYLIEQIKNNSKKTSLNNLFSNMKYLVKDKTISTDEINIFFYNLIMKNKKNPEFRLK